MARPSWIKRKIAGIRAFSNPRGILYLAQRRVRGAQARQRIARTLARFLPPAGVASPKAQRLARELDEEGFTMVEGVVTPEMVKSMVQYFRQHKVTGGFIEAEPVSIDDPNLPDSHVFALPQQAVLACPHVLDIANHPDVIAAVEGVFGCKPTIGYMTAWWSVPTADGAPRQAENYHRDYDDINFIKFFVYLTDVEVENGPHEFIRGSHKDAALRDIRRYSDSQVMSAYSNNRLVRFTGKAGSAFLENTTGLHRGQPVHRGKRLILQIVYSVLPMAYGPARPFKREIVAETSQAIDPYINRMYVARRPAR